jgi:DnaJ-class molecular chaperone
MMSKVFVLIFISFCSFSFCQAQTTKEKAKCQICKGSGKYEVRDSCAHCHGNGKVIITCKTCKGKGSISCPACSGSGVLKQSGNFDNGYQSCKKCRGKGYISCPSCAGSKKQNVFCENCQGRGFLKRSVPCDHKTRP